MFLITRGGCQYKATINFVVLVGKPLIDKRTRFLELTRSQHRVQKATVVVRDNLA